MNQITFIVIQRDEENLQKFRIMKQWQGKTSFGFTSMKKSTEMFKYLNFGLFYEKITTLYTLNSLSFVAVTLCLKFTIMCIALSYKVKRWPSLNCSSVICHCLFPCSKLHNTKKGYSWLVLFRFVSTF